MWCTLKLPNLVSHQLDLIQNDNHMPHYEILGLSSCLQGAMKQEVKKEETKNFSYAVLATTAILSHKRAVLRELYRPLCHYWHNLLSKVWWKKGTRVLETKIWSHLLKLKWELCVQVIRVYLEETSWLRTHDFNWVLNAATAVLMTVKFDTFKATWGKFHSN